MWCEETCARLRIPIEFPRRDPLREPWWAFPSGRLFHGASLRTRKVREGIAVSASNASYTAFFSALSTAFFNAFYIALCVVHTAAISKRT